MTLNRTQLKYIAVAAMLIDHIGMMFISVSTPVGALCRIIGRLTAPIMCMFLAEGYKYTRSKGKYALRLFAFALISQPFYAMAHNNDIMDLDFNMIFTLFLSFMALLCFDKIENRFLSVILVFFFVVISDYGDWGITAPLWVLCFYRWGEDKNKSALAFSGVAVLWILRATYNCVNKGFPWYGEYCQIGLFLFLGMLFLYNGEKGSNSRFSKWFFYLFYPLHLFVLTLIKNML